LINLTISLNRIKSAAFSYARSLTSFARSLATFARSLAKAREAREARGVKSLYFKKCGIIIFVIFFIDLTE